MAETKRAPITTLSGPFLKKKKEGEESSGTLRFELELGEPSDNKCAEFYYPELVRGARVRRTVGSGSGSGSGSCSLLHVDW